MPRFSLPARAWLALACFAPFSLPAANPEPTPLPRLHTYATWLNGWRQAPDATAPRLFAIEASDYEFVLDPADLSRAGFAPIDGQPPTYLAALERDPRRLQDLPPADLRIEVEVAGKTYRARDTRAGTADGAKALSHAWMWESGRYVQHYEFKDLRFLADDGQELAAQSSLRVVAWPDSLGLTASLSPVDRYTHGPMPGRFGDGLALLDSTHEISGAPDPAAFTLALWVKIPPGLARAEGWLLSRNGNEVTPGTVGLKLVQKNLQAVMNVGGRYHAIPALPNTFVTDKWIHVALTYDGDRMTYYLDGKRQGTRQPGMIRQGPGGVLKLSGAVASASPLVPAIFDELEIWDRALPAADLVRAAAATAATPRTPGLVFHEDFQPGPTPRARANVWTDAQVRLSLGGKRVSLRSAQTVAGAWAPGQSREFALTYDAPGRVAAQEGVSIQIEGGGARYESTYSPVKNCHVVRIDDLKRDFKGGYTDIRDYDELRVTAQNPGTEARQVPFLLDLRRPANITGIIPLLCDEEGRPLGVPMQLSKNWHYPAMNNYLMAYAYLPAAPGVTTYRIRIPYGFYGTLPVASHAQLSLVGYGGNGRWDQLAIGCWGETICFDMDMSLVDVAVTDVRLLMARHGDAGKKWQWTTAGWGGDWLGLHDATGRKIPFGPVKTAYVAHGPCLTDVRYSGAYGADERVRFRAEVGTPRTDDYVRTYQRLSYDFRAPASASDTWFYRLGSTWDFITPRLAYGNRAGLIEDLRVPANLAPLGNLFDRVELTGEGPWWLYLPDADNADADRRPGGRHTHGDRALVIRSYRAVFDGQVYTRPSFSARNLRAVQDGKGAHLNLYLVPPAGVAQIKAGDRVELDVALVTLPRTAEDYYGPNEVFRRQLAEHPSSWRTIHREAAGNTLSVRAKGGEVLRDYPIVIRATAPVVEVEITGGTGYVPIRFEGLAAPVGNTLHEVVDGKQRPLDQAVHGNDFWQTDHADDGPGNTLVYNLPLDGKPSTVWRLHTGSLTP